MAGSILTQIALVVAGVAILLIITFGGWSRSLKGGIVEIAIVVAAALIIAAADRLLH